MNNTYCVTQTLDNKKIRFKSLLECKLWCILFVDNDNQEMLDLTDEFLAENEKFSFGFEKDDVYITLEKADSNIELCTDISLVNDEITVKFNLEYMLTSGIPDACFYGFYTVNTNAQDGQMNIEFKEMKKVGSMFLAKFSVMPSTLIT